MPPHVPGSKSRCSINCHSGSSDPVSFLKRNVRKSFMETVPINSLDADQFKPPIDPTFNKLIELAAAGDLYVYFAAIPPAKIRPYSNEFVFREQPHGEEIVNSILKQVLAGEMDPPRIWVYESGDGFIMSDDYASYESFLIGKPDAVGCYVLGKPTLSCAQSVQGPINARQALGLE